MKLLVDMNLSPDWVRYVVDAGFEAVHWASVGDPRAPDRELLGWAREHGFVVFSHDLDFSTLLALTGDRGPSVVQMRTHDVLPDRAGPEVVRSLRAYAAELELGVILTIDPLGARVRALPVGRGRGPGRAG